MSQLIISPASTAPPNGAGNVNALNQGGLAARFDDGAKTESGSATGSPFAALLKSRMDNKAPAADAPDSAGSSVTAAPTDTEESVISIDLTAFFPFLGANLTETASVGATPAVAGKPDVEDKVLLAMQAAANQAPAQILVALPASALATASVSSDSIPTTELQPASALPTIVQPSAALPATTPVTMAQTIAAVPATAAPAAAEPAAAEPAATPATMAQMAAALPAPTPIDATRAALPGVVEAPPTVTPAQVIPTKAPPLAAFPPAAATPIAAMTAQAVTAAPTEATPADAVLTAAAPVSAPVAAPKGLTAGTDRPPRLPSVEAMDETVNTSRSTRPGGTDPVPGKIALDTAINADVRTKSGEKNVPDLPVSDFQTRLDRAAPMTPAAASLSNGSPANPDMRIDTPFGQSGWHDEVGQKLTWMVGNNRQQADLVLNPPQLGRVEVSLTMNGDQATAIFTSSNPAVREALENSLHRLREVLADAGVSLGQAQVGSESPHQSSRKDPLDFRVNEGPGYAAAIPLPGVEAVARTSAGRSMIDVFA